MDRTRALLLIQWRCILKSEDFYRDAHRIIYDAILEIVHANKTADFITVGEELDRRKRLDAVGGSCIYYIFG